MKLIPALILTVSLFSAPALSAENSGVTFKTLLKSSTSWDGSKLKSYGEGEPEITILKVVVQPGAVVPSHKHPVINAAVILSGEISVFSSDGNMQTFKSGEPVIELVDKFHYGRNTGSIPAEILVFYAGIQGKPLSIHEVIKD